MSHTWRVPEGAQSVKTQAELRDVLLANRGVVSTSAEQFFAPTYIGSIHDPLTMHDMERAVERIFQAIGNKERILIWGDYDADGISATAVLVSVLTDLGGRVTPYLPHREQDGYALNRHVLETLIREFDVLISADCGISNVPEIAWLTAQKKDVIVVDHHEFADALPQAIAIIHPRLNGYAFGHLSGSGVAWKLAQALARDKRAKLDGKEDYEKWLLDLAVLGTVGDVVPLTGENRAITAFGLQILQRTRRPGLRALLAACRMDGGSLKAEDVAFRLVPRLNAAGRMDHPQPALDLLLTQDEARAQDLVQQLNEYNQRRQQVTKQVMREAEGMVDLSLPFVMAWHETWPVGIVGLAAGKLAEAYQRPAIVMGKNGEQWVGSARAPKGANVLQLLERARKQTLKLGGHERAAGFSLAVGQLKAFREVLGEVPNSAPGAELGRSVEAMIDAELISRDTLELMERLEPFGEGNPQPEFAAKRLNVLEARAVGKNGDHAKVLFEGFTQPIDAIGFNLAEKVGQAGKTLDAAFTIEVNEWRGRRSLQMSLKDVAPAGSVRIDIV